MICGYNNIYFQNWENRYKFACFKLSGISNYQDLRYNFNTKIQIFNT